MNEIKQIPIEDFKMASYNPRFIGEDEMDRLKKSLLKFGFVEPVVVNKDMTVIGGHQRIKAWKELGQGGTIPAVVVDITKKEEKALNLALNKISGQWDRGLLYEVIKELSVEEELDLTGFDDKEISNILDSTIEDIEDGQQPEFEEVPVRAKLGEIYQLGKHRLMCGDSTSKEDIKELMGDVKADIVWTDPPYNVDYESSKEGKIKNDKMSAENFNIFINQVFENLSEFSNAGAATYICSGWQSFPTFKDALAPNNLHLSEVIIWVKNRGGIATIDYPHKHEQILKAKKGKKKKGEMIMYGWKEGAKRNYYGDHGEYDVWEMDRLDSSQYIHPTEKPDWLIMKALRNSSKFKDNLLDLFGGGGSALMACEKMGRNCYMCELDNKFVDAIINKWEKYTKKKAKLITEEPKKQELESV